MGHYYAVVAEWCGIRRVFKMSKPVVAVGDTVYGRNADGALRGHRAIADPEIIVCGSGADTVLQSLCKDGIPEITRVTREIWTKEATGDDVDG